MKILVVRYAGTCATCGAALEVGDIGHWHMRGVMTCATCPFTFTPEEWQARQDAKAERYQGYADNAASRSQSASDAAHALSDMIPLGQPILVGHHSEGRARRDADRIHNGHRKAIDESRRSDYWQVRANHAASNRSISSYDPDAIDKLRSKLVQLEAERDGMKAINAAFKRAGLVKGGKITAELIEAAAQHVELSERSRANLLTMHRFGWETAVFDLSHINANIRRYRQRLEALTQH